MILLQAAQMWQCTLTGCDCLLYLIVMVWNTPHAVYAACISWHACQLCSQCCHQWRYHETWNYIVVSIENIHDTWCSNRSSNTCTRHAQQLSVCSCWMSLSCPCSLLRIAWLKVVHFVVCYVCVYCVILKVALTSLPTHATDLIAIYCVRKYVVEWHMLVHDHECLAWMHANKPSVSWSCLTMCSSCDANTTNLTQLVTVYMNPLSDFDSDSHS
jgi:hypothetical protein